MQLLTLSKECHELFVAYAKDAGNWSGTPMVGGNITSKVSDRGYLTDLKKKGLITTDVSNGCTWIYFTEAGKSYASRFNIEL